MDDKALNLRLILLTGLTFYVTGADAAWSNRDRANGEQPIAYIENAQGQRAEIYADSRNTVFLRFVLNDGFDTFSEANCPTFQIDKRKPMHHFKVGPRCAVVAKRATYRLGQINEGEIESLILHRFMNGTNVTFRYATDTGQYRQATFSLRSSKQALKRALGFNLRVVVDN